jgi:hypothetical protein
VQHEDGLAGRDTATRVRVTTRANGSIGIVDSIRPCTAVPPTVLIAGMRDGGLFLKGWRDGPSAYLTASDAMPLRCVLAAAFGCTALARCGDSGETL